MKSLIQKDKELTNRILLKNRKKTLLVLLLSVIILTFAQDLWMVLLRVSSTRWEWPDLIWIVYQMLTLLVNFIFFLFCYLAVRREKWFWAKALFFAYFGFIWLTALFDFPSGLANTAIWAHSPVYFIDEIIDLLAGLLVILIGAVWLFGLSGRLRNNETAIFILTEIRFGLLLGYALFVVVKNVMLLPPFSDSEIVYTWHDLPWDNIMGLLAQLPITLIFYVGRGYIPAEGKTGGPERIVSAPDKGPEGGGGAVPQESRPAVQAAPVPGGYSPDEGGTPGGGEQKNE